MKKYFFLLGITLLFLVLSCKTKPAQTANNKSQEAAPILEKYWKLVEIYGKPVNSLDLEGDAFMILKMTDNKVTGNSGCNSFFGTYELLEGNRITFSAIGSTRKACLNMNVEQQLFEVLEMADNYTVFDDTLSLNKARMAPLAVFEAVYMD